MSGQAAARASTSLSQLCLYNFLDIAAALGLALVVNVAVLLVAAATFHQAGALVGDMEGREGVAVRVDGSGKQLCTEWLLVSGVVGGRAVT